MSLSIVRTLQQCGVLPVKILNVSFFVEPVSLGGDVPSIIHVCIHLLKSVLIPSPFIPFPSISVLFCVLLQPAIILSLLLRE